MYNAHVRLYAWVVGTRTCLKMYVGRPTCRKLPEPLKTCDICKLKSPPITGDMLVYCASVRKLICRILKKQPTRYDDKI